MPNEQQIREIIRDELSNFMRTERFTFEKLIQLLDGKNIQVGEETGTKIATETTQELGLWNVTPVVQPSSAGEIAGFTNVGSGTEITEADTFTGNSGSTAYTIGDIVKHLKATGVLKA